MPPTTATSMPPMPKPNRLIVPPQKKHNNKAKASAKTLQQPRPKRLPQCHHGGQCHTGWLFFPTNPCSSMMRKHDCGTANNTTAWHTMPQHDAQCHGMQECFVSCCITKNNSIECFGTSFLAVAQKNMTAAQRTMPPNDATCCRMQWQVVFCWGTKKWQHRMLCNAAAHHFSPWHEEWCHESHSLAMAQSALPWHEEWPHGMKNDATACSTMLKENGCGTKRLAMAWSTMLQHKKHCHSMKCHAASRRIWPRHQHQTPAPPGWLFFKFEYLDFPPKLFWFAVEGFQMSWFTGDCNTFSTCACQHRKYFAKPLLLGFYFA